MSYVPYREQTADAVPMLSSYLFTKPGQSGVNPIATQPLTVNGRTPYTGGISMENNQAVQYGGAGRTGNYTPISSLGVQQSTAVPVSSGWNTQTQQFQKPVAPTSNPWGTQQTQMQPQFQPQAPTWGTQQTQMQPQFQPQAPTWGTQQTQMQQQQQAQMQPQAPTWGTQQTQMQQQQQQAQMQQQQQQQAQMQQQQQQQAQMQQQQAQMQQTQIKYEPVQNIEDAIPFENNDWKTILGDNLTVEGIDAKFRNALRDDISDAHKYIFMDGAGDDIIARDFERNINVILAKARAA